MNGREVYKVAVRALEEGVREALAKNSAAASETAPVRQPAMRGNETILVAEDDSQVRDLTVAILRACGYIVIELVNVGDAERLCKEHSGKIDLLLTDVVMPETSGPELAQRFLRLRPDAKVLFMSGYTDTAIVHQGVLDPGIAFLPKPFHIAALRCAVLDQLREARRAASLRLTGDRADHGPCLS